MQTHIAHTVDEIRDIPELTDGETWDHARDFLAAAPDDPFADHLRVLMEDGRPVACVQVFLHRYPVGRAEVGMCLPEYPFVPPELRGRGHFKHLMADLFDWMSHNGYPLAYAHGRKGLYTGIGFAPCFHHCLVLLRVSDALNLHVKAEARRGTEEDVQGYAHVFRRPFPLGRGLQCRDEAWEPAPDTVRLVPGLGGAPPRGFVVTRPPLPDDAPRRPGGAVTVSEGHAADAEAAAILLRTVAQEAAEAGCEWLRLNCRCEDPLARFAVLAGGQLRWSAAQERDATAEGEDVDAFYLADLRLALEQLMPELADRFRSFTGDAPRALVLAMDKDKVALSLRTDLGLPAKVPADAPTVHLPRKPMTQAIMGYARPGELELLHEGCRIPESCRGVVDALFAAREPHLIHEGQAFARLDKLGLVP
ncbi:MAG: GNAT family N-acetyltransferase [Candidatus Brocadiia bacterium]